MYTTFFIGYSPIYHLCPRLVSIVRQGSRYCTGSDKSRFLGLSPFPGHEFKTVCCKTDIPGTWKDGFTVQGQKHRRPDRVTLADGLGTGAQRTHKWRKAAKAVNGPGPERPMTGSALEVKRLRKALK